MFFSLSEIKAISRRVQGEHQEGGRQGDIKRECRVRAQSPAKSFARLSNPHPIHASLYFWRVSLIPPLFITKYEFPMLPLHYFGHSNSSFTSFFTS